MEFEEKKNISGEENMKNIESNLGKLMTGYIDLFLNKFDNFTHQIKIAEILLNAYEYIYNKIKGKLDNIKDISENDEKVHKEFIDKCSKLAYLQQKMTSIEQKLDIINDKIDNMIEGNNNKEIERKESKDSKESDSEGF